MYVGLAYAADIIHITISNYGVILRRHEKFERIYPEFSLWKFQIQAKRFEQIIYIFSEGKSEENNFKNMTDFKRIIDQKKDLWKQNGCTFRVFTHEIGLDEFRISGQGVLKRHWFSEWAFEVSVSVPEGSDIL